MMLKYFLQIFIAITFISSFLHANEYKDIVTVKLKKDEHKKVIIKYARTEKLFKFRWTLYANGGLVVLHSYDRIVGQTMLYDKRKSRSFRVELITRGGQHYAVPYILVKFVEFDYETGEAMFQLFLSDTHSKVSAEYLKQEN